MRSVIAIAAFGLALTAAALAQSPRSAPYKAVEVTLPAALKDPSFEAFRKQLAAVARKQDRAALRRLVTPSDFFWEADFGGLFDEKKSGFDNLLRALPLNVPQGWADLAAFAAEPTVGPLDGHPGVVCAPAPPRYADVDLDPLLDATRSDVIDWYYPRQSGLEARAEPDAKAAAVESIGLVLVRVLGFDRGGDERHPSRSKWARIATPGGRIGFVAPGTLLSPLANRLCFRQSSGWRIAGFVGGGD